MLEKCKAFCRYLWRECKDVRTIALFFAVVIVGYSPAWGGLILYVLSGNEWFLAGATSWVLFWAGPFTPFFPLCLAVTLAIRRLLRHNQTKGDENDKTDT